jgi:hypothetical protein
MVTASGNSSGGDMRSATGTAGAGATSILVTPTGDATVEYNSSGDNAIRNGGIAGAVLGSVGLIGLMCFGCWQVGQNRRSMMSSRGMHHELPTTEH